MDCRLEGRTAAESTAAIIARRAGSEAGSQERGREGAARPARSSEPVANDVAAKPAAESDSGNKDQKPAAESDSGNKDQKPAAESDPATRIRNRRRNRIPAARIRNRRWSRIPATRIAAKAQTRWPRNSLSYFLGGRPRRLPSVAAVEEPQEPPKEEVPPAPAPEPVPGSTETVEEPPTIHVLILRNSDDLTDVPRIERIGRLILTGDDISNRSLRGLEGLSCIGAEH